MSRQKEVELTDTVSMDRTKYINRTHNRWRKTRQTPPRDYAELISRLDEYFDFVERTEGIPDTTELRLCVGASRWTWGRYLNGSTHGDDPRWKSACEGAMDAIEAAVASAGNDGRLNVVRSVWLEKSRFGFRDEKGESEVERMARIGDSQHITQEQWNRLLSEYLPEELGSSVPGLTAKEIPEKEREVLDAIARGDLIDIPDTFDPLALEPLIDDA